MVLLLDDIFRCIFFIEIPFIENGIKSVILPNVEMPFHLTCQSLPALHLGIGKLLV